MLTLFFEFVQDRVSADTQHSCGIADAAAIEGHIDYLASDFRYSTSILVVQEKDPPGAPTILTLIALGPPSLACPP